jgi:hypothetical protein
MMSVTVAHEAARTRLVRIASWFACWPSTLNHRSKDSPVSPMLVNDCQIRTRTGAMRQVDTRSRSGMAGSQAASHPRIRAMGEGEADPPADSSPPSFA